MPLLLKPNEAGNPLKKVRRENFSAARIAWVVEKEMTRPKGFEPLIPRFRGRAERCSNL